MTIVWNIVYFGNILCGTVLNKFFQKYWQSGHFSTGSRVKFAIKKLLIPLMLGIFLLIVMAALFYFVPALHDYRNMETMDSVKAGILVLSNLYGQLVMVILLSYGLFRVPVFLWRRADHRSIMMDNLRHADIYYRKFRDACNEFHKQVSICNNLAEKYEDVGNKQYFDVLMAEMPSKDLEGEAIPVHKSLYMVVKKGQVVGEDFIAQIRVTFKKSYF
jgi:hypothetical protein